MKKTLRRIGQWIDDRSGLSEMLQPLMQHKVPRGLKWNYVFGSATLFCFILQIVTGSALALMYQPSSDKAFASLQYITERAVMGKWLRGIHYFGASAMMLLAGIHMLRVYLTAAYKYPREMSWVSGIILLLLTTVMGFTGQLLRWDDNGVWSAVVAAEQLGRVPLIGPALARLLMGGDTLGGHTLSRFYTYHVFMVPGLLILFLCFHLWLVVRNGISEPPKAGRPVDPKTYRAWYRNALRSEGIAFWPYVAWRDVVFSVAVLLLVALLAAVAGPPPLRKPPDPSIVYTQPKPDWYLLWIYALFALMPPEVESYAMFFGPLIVLFLLFALPFLSNKGERSPLKRPWAVAGSIAVIVLIGALLLAGNKAGWSPAFKQRRLPQSVAASATPDVRAGKMLFEQKGCLYCHRIGDKGGIVGPDLTHVGSRLSVTEMHIRILNGSTGMPAYGRLLRHREMQQLIAFLQSRK